MMPWGAPGPHPAVAVCPSGLIHCLVSLAAYGWHLSTHGEEPVKPLGLLSLPDLHPGTLCCCVPCLIRACLEQERVGTGLALIAAWV